LHLSLTARAAPNKMDCVQIHSPCAFFPALFREKPKTLKIDTWDCFFIGHCHGRLDWLERPGPHRLFTEDRL
jgi:hypothetical protein